jgi:hypothetical protein
MAGADEAKESEAAEPVANEPVAAASVSPSPTVAGEGPKVDSPRVKDGGPEPDERATVRERTRETLQRASQRTRGAIEGNVKRVEKIHHVSSVVFEEAHYDPSLRFVLVALGLFVLFIVLLVLSKVMG